MIDLNYQRQAAVEIGRHPRILADAGITPPRTITSRGDLY
jgi:hypothetical protein